MLLLTRVYGLRKSISDFFLFFCIFSIDRIQKMWYCLRLTSRRRSLFLSIMYFSIIIIIISVFFCETLFDVIKPLLTLPGLTHQVIVLNGHQVQVLRLCASSSA